MDEIINKIDILIEELENIDKYVRDNHLENEQWFINYQDKINEISVR